MYTVFIKCRTFTQRMIDLRLKITLFLQLMKSITQPANVNR